MSKFEDNLKRNAINPDRYKYSYLQHLTLRISGSPKSLVFWPSGDKKNIK